MRNPTNYNEQPYLLHSRLRAELVLSDRALKADGTVPTSVSELARNPIPVRLK